MIQILEGVWFSWTSPDSQYELTIKQIDYILCSQRWRSSIQSAKTRPGTDCGSDHELLIAKFRLKLKKVGKTTRPFRYDLNQIPLEVGNRFKELDLIDRVPEELDCKESWVLKNWCFWTVVLEKTLESPLDCKEIQPVYSKGDQSWVFIGRTDVEAETPKLWPPDAKNWLIWKDPDAGKDWRQEEKGTTEDEIVGWHYLLNGHEFE